MVVEDKSNIDIETECIIKVSIANWKKNSCQENIQVTEAFIKLHTNY